MVATASGSIVMALGIFGVAALPQLAKPALEPVAAFAIALFAIWVFIAASYARSYLTGRIGDHIDPPVGRYAVGSWVAGTAVLLRMVVVALPQWRPLAIALGVAVCGGWLWFLMLAARGLRQLWERSSATLVPGMILLSTVSTQSLVLVLFDLLPSQAAWYPLAAGLCAAGLAFYIAGVALMTRSHRAVAWTLKDDWSNTNCILHGALSITGLAAATWQLVPEARLQVLWLGALLVLVLVEAIELARLIARVRSYGWRRGVFSYDVSQWSRNFTFGMFYAFTLVVTQQPGWSADAGLPTRVQAKVVAHGHYVVLAFLLVEIALFASAHLHREPKRS